MVAEGTNDNGSSTGHRERLRQRFSEGPAQLSDAQRLELLLTFAIPRRDVAPLATRLIERFGSLDQVISAPKGELATVEGVGDQTAILIQLVATLRQPRSMAASNTPAVPATRKSAPCLFETAAHRPEPQAAASNRAPASASPPVKPPPGKAPVADDSIDPSLYTWAEKTAPGMGRRRIETTLRSGMSPGAVVRIELTSGKQITGVLIGVAGDSVVLKRPNHSCGLSRVCKIWLGSPTN